MGKAAAQKHTRSPEHAFGRALRKVRQQRGLSQEALAFVTGYHRTYIGMLERGESSPSLRTIFNLAASLRVRPSRLVKASE